MEDYLVVDAAQQALQFAVLLALPLLVVGVIVGLVVGVLQAATGVQDPAVSFVPKIIAIGIALALMLPWLAGLLSQYSRGLIENLPHLLRAGP